MSAAPLQSLSLKSLRVRRDAYKPDRSCIIVERRADKHASEGDEDAAEHEEVCVCVSVKRECEYAGSGHAYICLESKVEKTRRWCSQVRV